MKSIRVAFVMVLLAGLPRAEVRAGEHTLFYGDMLVERLMEAGHVDAWLQLALPNEPQRLRSLAWTGDEVGYRLRPEGYAEHLKNLLSKWPAKRVILACGTNESFAGSSGVTEFKTQLKAYVAELQRRHPTAELVLLTPVSVEDGVQGHPDSAARNRDVELYARAMAETAADLKLRVIDLHAASRALYAQHTEALTTDGIHLSAAGARVFGRVVAAGLAGEEALRNVEASRVEEVAKAFAQKNGWVAEVVRPKNAVVYYGVRRRAKEYEGEMPRYFQMIEQSEALAQELARSPGKKFTDLTKPYLPPPPPGQARDAGKGTGRVKPAAEAQAEFTVADGFSVNLFASEEQFPELRAPVQIAFDARGRLWVVTMPSFPHTVPGLPREDKVLILEDTDRDGRADTSTVFAEGLDALDGVAFHERGVLVSEQPRIWVMRDTNGDGRADSKEELLRGIDVTDSHHGGMIATDALGRVWFCDGVFHRSQLETPFGVHRAIDSTTLSLDPRTGRVETEWQSITPNPWKITYDRTGNMFQMYGDGLVLDGLPLTWTPLGAYNPFGHAKVLGYGKGSAVASISSPNFPDEYQQGSASAALLGSHAVSITKHNFSKGTAEGSGRKDIVSSPNPAFRPADLAFGFDGALYISDFTSAIIGHAQHPMRDPQWNHSKGRIWRATYNAKPVAKDWPKIEGAAASELCKLLEDSRDIVRHHVRIELRKLGAPGLAAVDAWIGAYDRGASGYPQAALEALFVAVGLGEARPELLKELLKVESPLHRAAAVRLIRYQAEKMPDYAELLHRMSTDPHPRVRMEVLDAVAHVRTRLPGAEHAIHDLIATEDAVKRMFADLTFGTQPLKGRSVEVLQVPREAQLSYWHYLGDNGAGAPVVLNAQQAKGSKVGVGLYRTWIEASAPHPATLSVRHGFVDVSINEVQMLSTDNQWSSEQQVQFELKKGLNLIEVQFRRLNGAPPPVFLFDPVGQPLKEAKMPSSPEVFGAFSAEWEKVLAARGNEIRIQAVPNKMQFAPRKFAVRAGQHVKLTFTNPDSMLHNLVVVDRGAEEAVGLLSDELAKKPDAEAQAFVPKSPKVLWATPLVAPEKTAQLEFSAPQAPGEYPFICTFPGHWRVMKGVMIVVAEGADVAQAAAAARPGERTLVKAWEVKDLESPLAAKDKPRDAGRGRGVFEAANCQQCHALDGKGGVVGPDLSAIGGKFQGVELLRQILDPSAQIEERYRNVAFTLQSGKRVIGQVLKEDAAEVSVLTNPQAPETLTRIPVAEIKARKALQTSPMPAGLLDTFKEQELLDLVEFLQSRKGK